MKGKYLLSAVIVATVIAPAAHAQLQIDATFDSSVSSAARADFNYAAGEYEKFFRNKITINIDLTTMSGGLGASSTGLAGYYTYDQVKNALTAKATTAAALSSVAHLNNDTGGNSFLLSTAEAKALGLYSGNGVDGTVYYNSGFNYATSPTNRGVGGYDLIGVFEHEISEVMGRFSLQGYAGGYDPFDLFVYKNGKQTVDSSATGVYLSVDGGKTDLADLNGARGGDFGDFSGVVKTDPFNASTGPNQAHFLNAADYTTMNILGYQPAATPEPGPMVVMGLGVLGLVARRRRAPRKKS